MRSVSDTVQVSHGAIQFMVYEELKKAARGSLSTKVGSNGELGSAEISFMGAASKLVASIATYPLRHARRASATHCLVPNQAPRAS